MYPYTITTLKPRCTGAFSHGICLCNIYHIIYHDGISMVYVQKTCTIPQTLCTSAFWRGNGIWVYDLCLKHKNSRKLPIPSSYGRWYSSLRLGFMGNHPLSTRFFCSKSSPMPHSAEAPNTPTTAEMMAFSMNSAATMEATPTNR